MNASGEEDGSDKGRMLAKHLHDAIIVGARPCTSSACRGQLKAFNPTDFKELGISVRQV